MCIHENNRDGLATPYWTYSQGVYVHVEDNEESNMGDYEESSEAATSARNIATWQSFPHPGDLVWIGDADGESVYCELDEADVELFGEDNVS